jgi:hypothetical protein
MCILMIPACRQTDLAERCHMVVRNIMEFGTHHTEVLCLFANLDGSDILQVGVGSQCV